jgi:hypothetical protein
MTEEHHRATRCSNSGPQCPGSPVNPGEPQNAPRDLSAGGTVIWVMVGKSPDPLGCLRSKGFLRRHGKYRSRGKTMRPSCYIIEQSIILGGTDDENPPTQRVNQAVLLSSFEWIEKRVWLDFDIKIIIDMYRSIFLKPKVYYRACWCNENALDLNLDRNKR